MNNGDGENRLNRIELAVEALVRSQSHLLEAQTGLEREHKDLLRSQILMQDEIAKLASGGNQRISRIETKLDEATDKLNGIINLMDRHLREHDQGRV